MIKLLIPKKQQTPPALDTFRAILRLMAPQLQYDDVQETPGEYIVEIACARQQEEVLRAFIVRLPIGPEEILLRTEKHTYTGRDFLRHGLQELHRAKPWLPPFPPPFIELPSPIS